MSDPTPRPPDDAPLPLEYETRRAAAPRGDDVQQVLWAAIRRIVFAVGLGLFMTGVGTTWMGRDRDGPLLMGWGAALIGLTLPLPPWRRRAD